MKNQKMTRKLKIKSQNEAIKAFTPRNLMEKSRAEWRREVRAKQKQMKRMQKKVYGNKYGL